VTATDVLNSAGATPGDTAIHLDPDQPLLPGHSSDDPAGIGAGVPA
jgi:thioredoxin reductase (NADPH)